MKSATGLCILIAVGLGAPADAHAFEGRVGPPGSGGWLQIRSGVTFADSLTLNATDVGLTTTGDPGLVLGVGAHWRTSRLDFGALFESASSWRFASVSRDDRVGSQFRVAANLRWRYIEDTWGSLYLALSPGLTVHSHSPQLRFQVSQLDGSPEASVDTHTLGFSFGFDFGVLIYLSDVLGLALHLDLVTSSSALATESGEVDVDMVRGIFAVGLEWRIQ